jgi:hypothetical protein
VFIKGGVGKKYLKITGEAIFFEGMSQYFIILPKIKIENHAKNYFKCDSNHNLGTNPFFQFYFNYARSI